MTERIDAEIGATGSPGDEISILGSGVIRVQRTNGSRTIGIIGHASDFSPEMQEQIRSHQNGGGTNNIGK